METHEANVDEIDSEHYLLLKLDGKILKIPITKDEPKEVKSVFDELIKSLKNGPIEFKFKEVENGDIICQIGKAYISQLNTEMQKVYDELKSYDLLNES